MPITASRTDSSEFFDTCDFIFVKFNGCNANTQIGTAFITVSCSI